ncbi:MAG: hypothetical protein AVDCRST_MAG61-1886 [uncultured Friedmanniella sp.]|uniref:Uncharacterized protein n=1 Tax=uncultured Friedmanniella sp. TaxID=335381 RepID=A0A6J4KSP2_9ACTN|nr:MAG: hypothetical protein AVDCRST_MAG61-1886 [uncultured Friedmanniella sp.]
MLTGGPAVGKSTCAAALADAHPPTARIEVDDLRLLLTGAVPPWTGTAGEEQQALGARNACALARNFLAAGVDVVVTDVLTPATAEIYRTELPGVLVVRLRLDFAEAVRRASTRPVHLTEQEFAWVHRRDQDDPPDAEVLLEVDGWDVERQVAELDRLWAGGE